MLKNILIVISFLVFTKVFSQELQEMTCVNTINGDLHVRMIDCNNSIDITSSLAEGLNGTIIKGTITSLNSIHIVPGTESVSILPPPNNDILEIYSTRIAVVSNAENKQYYVSKSGNDNNSGTLISPFKTIKRAVDVAKPGDNVYIREGTYRERLDFNTNHNSSSGKPGGNYITFQNYDSENVIIKGSLVVNTLEDGSDAWILDQGNIWKYNGTWPKNPQQVFYDGKMLNKMGYPNNFSDEWQDDEDGGFGFDIYIPFPENNANDSILDVNDMWPGTFFYDDKDFNYNIYRDSSNNVKLEGYTPNQGFYSADLQGDLYIWLPNNENPNNHLIEVSDLRRLWLSNTEKYLKLKGLTFMHTNGNHYDLRENAVSVGPFSIVEDCTFAYCDFGALALSTGPFSYNSTTMNEDGTETINIENLGQVVKNCTFHHNGTTGFSANKVGGFLIENCTFYNNSNRPFNINWVSAAIKIIPDAWGVVKTNTFNNEHAHGIWFDTCRSGSPISISHNKLEHIGYKPDVPIWNTTTDEGERLHPHRGMGVFIEVTKNAKVYNNIIKDAFRRGIYIASSSENKIANNLIIGTEERGQIGINYIKRIISNDIFYTYNNEVKNNLLFEKKINNNVRDVEIFGSDFIPNVSDNTSIDYNLFYNDNNNYFYQYHSNQFDNLSDWYLATGFDEHSIQESIPQFIDSANNNWMLKANSPARDSGITLSYVMDDFISIPRPKGVSFDIGPYEFTFVVRPKSTEDKKNIENSLSISDDNLIDIHVYPNPTNGQINIKMNTYTKINLVKIIDVNGKTIMTYNENSTGLYNMSLVPSGFYIMSIQLSDGKIFQKKLIFK